MKTCTLVLCRDHHLKTISRSHRSTKKIRKEYINSAILGAKVLEFTFTYNYSLSNMIVLFYVCLIGLASASGYLDILFNISAEL